MAGLRDLLGLLVERADRHLPAGFYVAISVSTERVRDRLRRGRKPFLDPAAAASPELADVDETARWVVQQSSFGAASLGGLASMVGAPSVPPEALASAIAVLRLAQRLAVVYGFDPETDRGQMAVWRALAAGLEIELPRQGPLDMRLRDLPALLIPVGGPSATVDLARAVLLRNAWLVASRLSRLVPVVSSGLNAVASRRRMDETGARMMAALRRLVELPDELPPIEDAIVVG